MGVFTATLADRFRPWYDRLPPALRHYVRDHVKRWPGINRLIGSGNSRERRPGTIRWGNLRRTVPFSREWGYDRGTPVDRVYIEAFLAQHANDVRGVCLEVMSADYTRRFGASRVSRSEVLDINPQNGMATIVADLGEADSLPMQRFDCIVFTQTLHLVPDMRTAVANVWRALAPGGVLLVTVSALSRHDTRKGFHHDRWRVTKTGLEWLLGDLSGAHVETATYGNLLSSAAFLYGLAAEELTPDELHFVDPAFPLIIAARVHKEPGQ
jgi:SAM-dependent methyltransferase